MARLERHEVSRQRAKDSGATARRHWGRWLVNRWGHRQGWPGGVAYNILLCVGAKKVGMSKVTQDAARLNLPEEKLLGDWIVCIPGFTLNKYRQLQRSQLSIFTMNCFGGVISNTVGLPFYSPFINMFFEGYLEVEKLVLQMFAYKEYMRKGYSNIFSEQVYGQKV